MAIIRIHEKPNGLPDASAVFAIEVKAGGVWYTRKVTWEQLSGLIAAFDTLQNYYKKSETYTKTEVNQLIAAIPTFSVEIVQALPTEDISTTTLYLVPKTTAGTLDYYDEFINLDGTTSGWEYVGKTEVDLSNYYTKAETEAFVEGTGGTYVGETKTFSSLTTTSKTLTGAINETAGTASGAQTDATQALANAATAQGTANSASSAASAAQGTADNALTAAGNAASAASAAQQTANTAQTTANNMAVSITNTLTPTGTTQKLADVTQNSTTTSIYGDDATKVAVALTDTQTTTPGNPVTLTTEQSGGAKSAVVTFTPKQDLHGYDSPWVGGAGKNKFQNTATTQTINGVTFTVNSDGTVLVNGTATGGDSRFIVGSYTAKAQSSQILNGLPDSITDSDIVLGYQGYGMVNTVLRELKINRSAETDWSNNVYITVKDGITANNLVFKPMIRLSTETDPAFAPYSNICPISGWTELNLNQDTEHTETSEKTYTATFDSTVYGGSYDFVSGKGKSEWGYIAEYDGETVTEPWISSIDVYTPETTPSTGAEVAYKLATPTEITLTPEDIELLKGSNTVWSDANGTVTVGYSKLPNGNLGAVIDYIKQLEARISALES